MECPHCAREIADSAVCPYCRSAVRPELRPGRPIAQEPGADDLDGAPSLLGFWLFGAVLSVIGAGISTGDERAAELIGFALAVLGGALLLVAVVATGVSIGMQHRDALRRNRRR
ncbi:MAG: hypothetical protein ACJ72E_01345 [Marmoricola sp.]